MQQIQQDYVKQSEIKHFVTDDNLSSFSTKSYVDEKFNDIQFPDYTNKYNEINSSVKNVLGITQDLNNTINTKFNQVDETITTINNTIENIDSTISDIQDTVSNMNNQIINLQSRCDREIGLIVFGICNIDNGIYPLNGMSVIDQPLYDYIANNPISGFELNSPYLKLPDWQGCFLKYDNNNIGVKQVIEINSSNADTNITYVPVQFCIMGTKPEGTLPPPNKKDGRKGGGIQPAGDPINNNNGGKKGGGSKRKPSK